MDDQDEIQEDTTSMEEKLEELEKPEDEDICPDCGGSGEVTTMEQVYANEPHMAPIGTRPCHCQSKQYDDMDDDSDNL